MRKLTPLGGADALLREVGTFANVLFIAVVPLVAVAKNSEVATDALSRSNMHVRERTIGAVATSVVGEVHAERRAFRRGGRV